MYFFSIEAFGEFGEYLTQDVDSSDFAKVTLISDKFDNDVTAHCELQRGLLYLTSCEDIKEFDSNFNPKFFPEGLQNSYSLIGDIEEISDNESEPDISFDGLPLSNEIIINSQDLILATYVLADDEFEQMIVRGNLITNVETYMQIDFDTNKVVH